MLANSAELLLSFLTSKTLYFLVHISLFSRGKISGYLIQAGVSVVFNRLYIKTQSC